MTVTRFAQICSLVTLIFIIIGQLYANRIITEQRSQIQQLKAELDACRSSIGSAPMPRHLMPQYQLLLENGNTITYGEPKR